MSASEGWTVVCGYDRLEPDRGVAALVDGVQVALFRTVDGLFALDNRDPLAGAYVLSRGIVGSRDGVPTLASPLHKQVYDLRTGECLDRPGAAVPVHRVRCRDGMVEVRLTGAAGAVGDGAGAGRPAVGAGPGALPAVGVGSGARADLVGAGAGLAGGAGPGGVVVKEKRGSHDG